MKPLLKLTLIVIAAAVSCLAADPSALRLVPFPKHVRLQSGRFALDRALVVEADRAAVQRFGRLIAAEFKQAGLRAPELRALSQAGHTLRLAARAGGRFPQIDFRDGATDQDYALEARPDDIVVAGKGSAGLFYGVQTLCQLLRANRDGNTLPALDIRDWPSIRWRCFQDDLTRGPSSTLEELKREAALGATLKLNLFTYYMEHQFAFRKHPVIGPANGSLLPQELKALVGYAKPLHMDILGNQQSFGHFAQILKHDAYKPLAETPGILSPVNEAGYKLLDDLYSEVLPLLPFPFFNVCCDETQGLGSGPSKPLADKIGVGGVYARHLRRIHDLLKDKYGKRMMMWGDIILMHPEHLKEIPTDTIMLTWGYGPAASFERQIIPFAQSGYEFFVCPGVNNWNRILPDFGHAATNICNFVRDGAKHGAIGVLNTSWDDDGETLNAPNWHGFAWGAECSWNASATPLEAFNRRIGAVLFGEKGDHFGQAIELLARTHRLPGMDNMHDRRFWQPDLGQVKISVKDARASAEKLLAIVRPAIEHLEACRKEATANGGLLDAVLFGARRMELIGQRMLDGLDAAAAYSAAYESPVKDAAPLLAKAEALVRRNRDAHALLAARFKELWLRENRPYALDLPLKRYQDAVAGYDSVLARLTAAKGRPLPPPKAVGLELLELGVRRTRPGVVVQTPLQPDSVWHDPFAKHRFGLVVNAGPVTRAELPIELDLRLPDALGHRPVRAFVSCGHEELEVPAQLDPTETPGVFRFAAIVHKTLQRGSNAIVFVYPGLRSAPPKPPNAVTTRDADKGMKWIENDKMRLLLGPEGAHIYRWEVKALDHRDVTMPGETGWLGFADLGGEHRSAPNTLTCVARGPALVRYVCTDPTGLVKTIGVFAGASWMEVTLNSPVRYYWDFDNPRNFAADGPTPGQYLFSTGAKGAVGRQADGVQAQVKANAATWAVKYVPGGLAMAIATPEAPSRLAIAPGAGAGGVGVEHGPTAAHFVTFAGLTPAHPRELMTRLSQTLDFRNPPEMTLHAIQSR